MRKAAIAERVLTLVLLPRHAASIIGDFLETRRGSLSFWSAVFRTFFSVLLRDLGSYPTPGTGPRFLANVPFPFSLILIVGGAGLFGLIAGIAFSWIEAGVGALNLPIWVANIATTFLIAGPLEYHVGRMIARWAPGKELSAWTSASVLQLGLLALIAFTRTTGESQMEFSVFANFVALNCMLAGTVRVRRQWLAAQRKQAT